MFAYLRQENAGMESEGPDYTGWKWKTTQNNSLLNDVESVVCSHWVEKSACSCFWSLISSNELIIVYCPLTNQR